MNHSAAAAENKPVDHVRVRGGRIQPSDLVYCFATKTFLRHDDPTWKSRCEYVADAVYVVRYSDRRTLPTTKKPEPQGLELTPRNIDQLSLF